MDSGHTWINRSLIRACFFLSFNSKVVLQQGEEMIYVDLISPLWWQRYDQMINGQPEKQELLMWPLGMHLIRTTRSTEMIHFDISILFFSSFAFDPELILSLTLSWNHSSSMLMFTLVIYSWKNMKEKNGLGVSHSLQELLLFYTYCSLLSWRLLKCYIHI